MNGCKPGGGGGERRGKLLGESKLLKWNKLFKGGKPLWEEGRGV